MIKSYKPHAVYDPLFPISRVFLWMLFIGLISASEFTEASSPDAYVWTKSKFNYHPENGCVPDAKTALKIADAVLVAAYGKDEVAWNKPFTAILRKGVWSVGGWGDHPGTLGGGMEIDIAKSDGRILRIYAGQ